MDNSVICFGQSKSILDGYRSMLDEIECFVLESNSPVPDYFLRALQSLPIKDSETFETGKLDSSKLKSKAAVLSKGKDCVVMSNDIQFENKNLSVPPGIPLAYLDAGEYKLVVSKASAKENPLVVPFSRATIIIQDEDRIAVKDIVEGRDAVPGHFSILMYNLIEPNPLKTRELDGELNIESETSFITYKDVAAEFGHYSDVDKLKQVACSASCLKFTYRIIPGGAWTLILESEFSYSARALLKEARSMFIKSISDSDLIL